MDILWFFSDTPSFYLAHDSEVLINNSAELLPTAKKYEISIGSVAEFNYQLVKAKTVVLVAQNKLFNQEYLASIPSSCVVLVILDEKTPDFLSQQLNAINSDACILGSVSDKTFSDAIEKASNNKIGLKKLQQELQEYTNIAFTAMSSASEMGVVAVFAEKTQLIMDIPQLAQLCLTSLRDLGVEGVVQFVFEDDVTIFPEDTCEAYTKLLSSSRLADSRIVSHGRFIVFSFAHVQLMITNAPIEDSERYGRLRDVLAPIVSITEARLKTLKVNVLLKAQQEKSKMVMNLLKMTATDNRNAVKIIMTRFSVSLRALAVGLEISLDKEIALLNLSDDALSSLEGLQNATGKAEEYFRSMLEQLDSATTLLSAADATKDPALQENGSKVELF